MRVLEHINVSNSRLIDGLEPVVRIMSQVEKSSHDDLVELDLSQTQFITPVFALSLLLYASRCGRQVTCCNIPPYLSTIALGNGGLKSDSMRRTEFLAIMERYSRKTYIPIVDFPATSNIDEKEAMSSIVEDIIVRQLNIRQNVASGLTYMIEETLDNIIEHSGANRGWLFAQSYPQLGFLDLCIADNGVTLLGSYQRVADNEISSDLEAIKAANRGISSKNRPAAENRGFGIRTSKRMLVDGLGGQYMMISGGCIYLKTPKQENVYNVPGGLRWNGTLVALRIPFNSVAFNYINYVE